MFWVRRMVFISDDIFNITRISFCLIVMYHLYNCLRDTNSAFKLFLYHIVADTIYKLQPRNMLLMYIYNVCIGSAFYDQALYYPQTISSICCLIMKYLIIRFEFLCV